MDHTQQYTRTHLCALPFWAQCLCECAGSTGGLWYVVGLEPWPETLEDRPATGSEEGVALCRSHSPTDQEDTQARPSR